MVAILQCNMMRIIASRSTFRSACKEKVEDSPSFQCSDGVGMMDVFELVLLYECENHALIVFGAREIAQVERRLPTAGSRYLVAPRLPNEQTKPDSGWASVIVWLRSWSVRGRCRLGRLYGQAISKFSGYYLSLIFHSQLKRSIRTNLTHE